MKSRMRRVMVWLTAAVAVAMALGLVILRSGRPLFYTDGGREIHARELVDASMMIWQSPVPVTELPGPVVGRVQTLADGSLLYGRGRGGGRTDLVAFDPRRPEVPPEVVPALMSRGHDLAPALVDEWLYFSSDRRGGAGGFDLYRARYRAGQFGDVERLPDTINSGLDESDPAPQPSGSRLVFVRRDPSRASGSNGALMIVDVNDGGEAVPLFDHDPLGAPMDRDPAFAPDGVGLWFVRQEMGARPVIARTWRHGEQFAPPVVVAFEPRGMLRAPDPIDGGFGLHLVQPASVEGPAILYRARAREVYPWWPAQAWLELLLLSAMLVSLLLLVMLLLGSRWRQLDVITWCLILSLVAHMLLMLWLTDVAIVRKFFPSDTEGGLEVQLVAAAAAASQGDGGVQPAQPDLSVDVRFTGHSTEIGAAAPASQVAEVARSAPAEPTRVDAAAPELSEGAAAPEPVAVADAATVAVRNSQDSKPALAARASAAAQLRSTVSAEHTSAAAIELAASAPAAAGVAAERRPAAARSERVADELRRQSGEAGVVVVADAPSTAPSRTATGDNASPSPEPTAVGETAQPVRPTPPARMAKALGDVPQPSAQAVASGLSSSTGVRAATPPVVVTPLAPRALSSSSPVRDSVSVTPIVTSADADPVLTAAAPAARQGQAVVGSPRAVAERSGRAAGHAAPVTSPVSTVSRVGARGAARSRAPALPTQTPMAVTGDGVELQDQVALTTPAPSAANGGDRHSVSLAAVGSELEPSSTGSIAVARSKETPSGAERSEAMPPTVASLGRVGRRSSNTARREAPALPSMIGRQPMVAVRDGVGAASLVPPEKVEPSTGAGLAAAAVMVEQSLESDGRSGRAQPKSRAAGSGALALAIPESGLRRRGGGRAKPRATASSAVPPHRVAAPTIAVRDGVGRDQPRTVPEVARGGDRAMAVGVGVVSGLELRPAEPTTLRPHRGSERRSNSSATIDVPLPASALGRAAGDRVVAASSAKVADVSDLFANRFGPKKAQALERFGGSVETERAVARGLEYLARIQNSDGSWGRRSHRDDKYGQVWIGKTGLCLLAFLGAGHTPNSGTEYSRVAARAVERLLAVQDLDSGAFGRTSSYSHGIATYALAECFGLTKREDLREPIDAALQWILANQSRSRDRRSAGGWGYFSTALRPEDGFSRTSITVWMVMAIESAKLSGLSVPQRAIDAAGEFLRRSWNPRRGHFYYNQRRDRINSNYPTLPGSTPASVFALMLLGDSANDPALKTGLEFTLDRKPDGYAPPSDDDFVLRAKGHVYFWYYGSLACFLAGGDTWDEWNAALKRVLPGAQSADGSFRPIGPYAEMADDRRGDRSFTTAMCVLSLEVYYRYFTPLLRQR